MENQSFVYVEFNPEYFYQETKIDNSRYLNMLDEELYFQTIIMSLVNLLNLSVRCEQQFYYNNTPKNEFLPLPSLGFNNEDIQLWDFEHYIYKHRWVIMFEALTLKGKELINTALSLLCYHPAYMEHNNREILVVKVGQKEDICV